MLYQAKVALENSVSRMSLDLQNLQNARFSEEAKEIEKLRLELQSARTELADLKTELDGTKTARDELKRITDEGGKLTTQQKAELAELQTLTKKLQTQVRIQNDFIKSISKA